MAGSAKFLPECHPYAMLPSMDADLDLLVSVSTISDIALFH